MFFVFANWKMAMSLSDVETFVSDWKKNASSKLYHTLSTSVKVSILPSFPFLSMIRSAFFDTPIAVGVQNCSSFVVGAYTGEVSASVARELGGSYVLIGHSERRRYQKETAVLLAQKMIQAYQANLTPIYCIGESLDDRSEHRTLSVLQTQLDDLAAALGGPIPPGCLIAYEPLWAIGTGMTPSIHDIEHVHDFLKNQMPDHSILYGGSVTPVNSGAISSIPGVDGLLVGGASTTARSLYDIICAVRA